MLRIRRSSRIIKKIPQSLQYVKTVKSRVTWPNKKTYKTDTCSDRKMVSQHLHPLPGKTTVSEMGLWPEPEAIQSVCRGCRNQVAAVIPKVQCIVSMLVCISAVSARITRRDCKAPKIHDATRLGFQYFHCIPSQITGRSLMIISFVSLNVLFQEQEDSQHPAICGHDTSCIRQCEGVNITVQAHIFYMQHNHC